MLSAYADELAFPLLAMSKEPVNKPLTRLLNS
jgi:hypothetical protein